LDNGHNASPRVHKSFAQRYHSATLRQDSDGSLCSGSPVTTRFRQRHLVVSSSLSELNMGSGRGQQRPSSHKQSAKATASLTNLRSTDSDEGSSARPTPKPARDKSSERNQMRRRNKEKEKWEAADAEVVQQQQQQHHQQVRFYNGASEKATMEVAECNQVLTAGPVRVKYNEGPQEKTELVQFNMTDLAAAMGKVEEKESIQTYTSLTPSQFQDHINNQHRVYLTIGNEDYKSGGIKDMNDNVVFGETNEFRTSRLLEQLGLLPAVATSSSGVSVSAAKTRLNGEQVQKLLRFRRFVRAAGLARREFVFGVERHRALEDSQTFDEEGVMGRMRAARKDVASKAATRKR
jgi:hypothetical protein